MSTILITGVGAEGQVGEIVARAFAERGSSLVLVDRTLGQAQARAADIVSHGHSARGYGCDLTDPDAVAALTDEVRGAHGDRLDALVHMAGGFAMSGPVADSSVDVWHRQIAINLTTAYLTTRAFLPFLRAARGSIVLFASEVALAGVTGANRSAYAAAKSGVASLMRSIAAEEREYGVRANALAPGAVRTGANMRALGADVHYVEREAVASAIVFLCSEEASAITGELLPLT